MSASTVTNETKPKMDAVVEDFKRKLSNVRTGRATVGLLDTVMVDYYGTPTPLNQMASVAVPNRSSSRSNRGTSRRSMRSRKRSSLRTWE
jgi:ribosome recycling factor